MDARSLQLFLALSDNLHFGRTSREQSQLQTRKLCG